jgi:hypothetical protein
VLTLSVVLYDMHSMKNFRWSLAIDAYSRPRFVDTEICTFL